MTNSAEGLSGKKLGVLIGVLAFVVVFIAVIGGEVQKQKADKSGSIKAEVLESSEAKVKDKLDYGWYEVVGTSGSALTLVVVNKDQGKYSLLYVAKQVCQYRDVCGVIYWDDAAKAARALPMTDAQVNSKIAHYQKNKHSGLNRLLKCLSDSCEVWN